ncbi:phage lysin, N-acetylmuramoyl-L-alanine amidase [Bacillus sp. JCM 19046]|nr:phage lysin, N-acetylmuramoyl-L-alanine amidase [Bacillus sp. JCM 19045]GAF18889.1 phage lysin, N-acetylmuramoyl-L-alanine amidase [Bacillus sp. JCM 19046]
MIPIRQQLVSAEVASRVTYGGTNPVDFIIVHQTGNTRVGADAQMHARLQSNGFSASWHIQVDDKVAIQSFPYTAQCWHAGDGRGPGNLTSVGVEICVNQDGGYVQAVKNGAEVVKQLMNQFNLPISAVKQHWDITRKNCPAQIRAGKDGIGWNSFLKLVKNAGEQVAGETVVNKPAPVKPSTGGESIVNWMNGKGMDSSYANRARLAAYHGISNYSGTATQNTQLLGILQRGDKPKPAPAKPKGNQTTGSIVVYLDSIGVTSSYSNRARLAQQHGISNYSGTAAQNTRLLDILRGGRSSSTPSKPAVRNGEGIVSWMNRAKMDSSYTNRARLAAQHGIKNYRGTATQNTRLLNIISV